MILPDAVELRIKDAFPDARIEMDNANENDGLHYRVSVESEAFRGKTPVEQHKMIYALFKDELACNEIHALALTTSAPKEG